MTTHNLNDHDLIIKQNQNTAILIIYKIAVNQNQRRLLINLLEFS